MEKNFELAMILNEYGQPTEPSNILPNFERTLKKAPILLTDSASFSLIRSPHNWSGCLYSSSVILREIEQKFHLQLSDKSTCALPVDEAVTLRMYDGHEAQVTMIPASKTGDLSMVAYIFQDEFITKLYVRSSLGFCLHTMLSSTVLRTFLCTEIDDLYIDDRNTEQNLDETAKRSNVFLWQALTYAVNPRHVYSTSDDDFPDCVKAMCRNAATISIV